MVNDDKLYQLQDGWMQRNARALDLAHWKYLTEKGTKQEIVEALAAYQNPDGGFGNALEADSWNPNSTPLQTWTATTILRELNLFGREIPLISQMVEYLKATLIDGLWPIVIPTNNDYPHAPWWTYDPTATTWDYNPTAGLLGYLARTGMVFEKEIGQALSSYFSRTIDNMHELRLFVDLCEDLEQIGWNDAELELMRIKMKQDCLAAIETDVEKWSDYVARPSAIIRSGLPTHLSFLRPLVEKEKANLLDTVNPDGTWNVSWDWGQFPEQFAITKHWCKAILIIRYHQFLAC